jgi:hypothetical protein
MLQGSQLPKLIYNFTYLKFKFLGFYITCVFGITAHCAYDPPESRAIPSNNLSPVLLSMIYPAASRPIFFYTSLFI